MDPLSDVLRVIRMTGALFFDARLSTPWAIASPPADQLAPVLRSRAESIALLHLLIAGRCWIVVGGQAPLELEAGSIVIFPHGTAHVMSSQPGLPPQPVAGVLRSLRRDTIPKIDYGGGGDVTHFVCGYLECEQRFNPLMAALPEVLAAGPDGTLATVSAMAGPAMRRFSGTAGDRWIETTLQYAIDEAASERPGSPAMVARLAELLFVAILRRHMQDLPRADSGWLAAVSDPEIGRALSLMHLDPGRKWTVEALARESYLSRSALAGRFSEMVGESPMRYLTRWRIQMARRLLRDGQLSITQVASRVGYESDAAFYRAFKRLVGVSPSAWRDRSASVTTWIGGE